MLINIEEPIINYLSNLYNLPGTVSYCEQAIGHIIKRPFDTGGNIVFLIVGIIILLVGRNKALARAFGWTTILIWLLSSIWDATASFLFQIFDFTGMFIFVTLLLFLNFERMGLKVAKIYRWLVVILGAAIFLVFGGLSPHVFFGALVFAVIITEFLARQKYSRKLWYLGLASFATGFIFWIIDMNKLICDPTKIFSGRNLEHLFFSIAIYLLCVHYSKIQEE
ncbi:MAG: hypothetical protein WC080_02680 [Patescibacteria group bacterium]